MEDLLFTIDTLLKELASLEPLSEQSRKELSKKFRLEFNYNSNHIEGNTLTYGQTELLLIFDKTEGSHDKRELDEMAGHDVAYKLIQEWAAVKEYKITERDLRELNNIILVRPFWKEALTSDGQETRRQIDVGTYKKHPNSVRLQNGEMFDYATPTDTPILMQELFSWLHQEMENKTTHPVQLAALLHYRFVRIHPFDDGNGRLSRLLMNYVLLYYGFPPVIVKSADKKNYLMALNRADAGNVDAFVQYIAEQLIWSLELYQKAHKGLSLAEPDDIDKELELLKRRLKKNEAVHTEIATWETKCKTITSNILPLFDSIIERFTDFYVFFLDKKFTYLFNTNETHNILGNPINNYEESFDDNKDSEIKNSWLSRVFIQDLGIQSCRFTFSLIGLKQSIEVRNFHISLNVNFTDFNYSIIDRKNVSKSYLYGKKFTETEIKEIAAPFIRQLMEEIDNELGKL